MYNNPEQPWRLFISKMFIISSYSIIYVQTWPKRETARDKSLGTQHTLLTQGSDLIYFRRGR